VKAPELLRALAARIRRAVRKPEPARRATGILRGPRLAALAIIAVLVAAASLVSFAESYRGLYDWSSEHGLTGIWAAIWPLQVDVFIAVGELALLVGLVDAWYRRSRTAAWVVTALGLAVSVAGNVGHVHGHALANRVTAAVPPIAAAAALAVGLGVLKRVVEHHHEDAPETPADAHLARVAADAQDAALAALKATTAAGNPLSARQLETRFGLSRADVTRVRKLAAPDRGRDGGTLHAVPATPESSLNGHADGGHP
jgi:Protein of unknown function (DUF2637)